MQAVMKMAAEPGAVEVRDVEQPRARTDEVLVRIAAASICGSDIHFYNWDPASRGFFQPPMVMGHEFAGTVVEVGPQVQGLKAGDRVCAESVDYCRECPACRRGQTQLCAKRRLFGIHRAGGMVEYVAVPERLLHLLPAEVKLDHAAVVEPAAVALHGVLLQPPRPGDVVLVTGPGPVGMLAAQAARAAGAHVFVAGAPADAEARLPLAADLGFEALDPAASPAETLQQRAGGLADVVIECSGNGRALAGALQAVRPGGGITLIGLFGSPAEVDLSAAIRKELTIRASYIGTWQDFERVLGMLASGTLNVEPLLRRYRLDQALQGFDDAMRQRVMKPLLLPANA